MKVGEWETDKLNYHEISELAGGFAVRGAFHDAAC